jgi:hypothetical protein
VSCSVLLALPGGCSHDLSSHDQAIAAGTRVSDLCLEECSGHAGCAPAALDVSFLNTEEDSSGAGVEVTLVGDVCVDAGGATFSGDGHVELDLSGEYAHDAAFTLAFWLLKAPANAWVPEFQNDLDPLSSEMIYSHHVPPGRGHLGITVMLRRGPWLGSWALIVLLDLDGVMSNIELHRDSVPKWTHVAVVIDGAQILLLEDGQRLPTSPMSLANDSYRSYPYWCRAPEYDYDGIGCKVHDEISCGESGCTHAEKVRCRNLCDADHDCTAFDIGISPGWNHCCLHTIPEYPLEGLIGA